MSVTVGLLQWVDMHAQAHQQDLLSWTGVASAYATRRHYLCAVRNATHCVI